MIHPQIDYTPLIKDRVRDSYKTRRQHMKVPELYDPDSMIVWILQAQSQPQNHRRYYVKHRKEILAKQAVRRNANKRS